jgi:hypothetical protein
MGPVFTFLCFGACKNVHCSYKHVANAAVQMVWAEAVAPKLGNAYKAYDAAH